MSKATQAPGLRTSMNLIESMSQHMAQDGQLPNIVELTNTHGMRVTFMDIGATWLSCVLPVKGKQREVLLGIATMDDFYKQEAYFGTTVGRYANRIAQGQFSINKQDFQVSTNQAGNCLHGGAEGFDKRRWNITEKSERSVLFSLESPDGDQGFPGNLRVSVRYELTDKNQLSINYLAKTDKPTVVNLTNHAYFNLQGANNGHDCLSHILSINAAHYLPINEVGIPVNGLKPVKSTSFDFTRPTVISERFLADEQQKSVKGYDHSFLLVGACKQGECAATVTSPDALVTLKVFTSKPAIQLYTGNWLAGTPNREGGSYKQYAGMALETQFLPDSPNHQEWEQESCVLVPEVDYAYNTCYQFDFSGDSSN